MGFGTKINSFIQSALWVTLAGAIPFSPLYAKTTSDIRLCERALEGSDLFQGAYPSDLTGGVSQRDLDELAAMGIPIGGILPQPASPPAPVPTPLDVHVPNQLYLDKVLEALTDRKYRIIKADFAIGGEGQVARAIDPLGREVFIKIPRTEKRPIRAIVEEARKIRLVRKAMELRGQGDLITEAELLDLGSSENLPLRAMQTLMVRNSDDPNDPEFHNPAPTLADRIQDGSLSDDMALKVISQLVNAIHQAHSITFTDSEGRSYVGVVNRDIKPSNILVKKNGNITLPDWGVSGPLSTVALSREGLFTGTINYASENAKMGGQIHQTDDIEPAQKTIYEILGRSFDLAPHTFERNAGFDSQGNRIPIRDYRHGPIFPGRGELFAIACYSHLPTDTDQWIKILNLKRSVKDRKTWMLEYGKIMRETPNEGFPPRPVRQVTDVLNFLPLIQEFPAGLGFTDPREVEAYINTAREMYRQTRRRMDPGVGTHGYLYYEEFFDRVAQLGLGRPDDPTSPPLTQP